MIHIVFHQQQSFCNFKLNKTIIAGKHEFVIDHSSLHEKYQVFLLDDGTEVDDEEYFQTLPDHTTFVLSKQRHNTRRPHQIRSR